MTEGRGEEGFWGPGEGAVASTDDGCSAVHRQPAPRPSPPHQVREPRLPRRGPDLAQPPTESTTVTGAGKGGRGCCAVNVTLKTRHAAVYTPAPPVTGPDTPSAWPPPLMNRGTSILSLENHPASTRPASPLRLSAVLSSSPSLSLSLGRGFNDRLESTHRIRRLLVQRGAIDCLFLVFFRLPIRACVCARVGFFACRCEDLPVALFSFLEREVEEGNDRMEGRCVRREGKEIGGIRY